jgi:hypothetical protein
MAATPDDEPARRAHQEPERRWYGWQIILTDGAALASLAAFSDGNGWADLALALYLGGGPVVHLAHQNPAQAGGSLGLRVLAPLGGALMGFLLSTIENPNCDCSQGLVGVGGGLVVGTLAASVVDITVLAYDVPSVQSRAHAEPLGLRLAPVAALPRDSTGHMAPTFGLVGSF